MPDVRTGRDALRHVDDALRHVDEALADRPIRDGETLKSATQCLAAFRDHVVQRHRQEGGTRWRATLERVNAVISVVMAAQFPLGEVPWDELEKARGWLAGIVAEEAQ